MAHLLEDESNSFTALSNEQGQYSLWPADLPAPAGWRCTGRTGTRGEVIAYIDAAWTDMRPAPGPGGVAQ